MDFQKENTDKKENIGNFLTLFWYLIITTEPIPPDNETRLSFLWPIPNDL